MDLPPAVPLFPLPNVVLFPRAVLPLHIFEERYKAMTAQALDGDRLIAMALLRPGWEKNYHGRPPIEPIVCVGKIVSWEKLPDGKYNFLLQGQVRARIEQESFQDQYRVAHLVRLEEKPALEIDLELERARMSSLFETKAMRALPLARQFRELLTAAIPTPDIADLAAFNLLDEISLKQELLADPDVKHRVSRIIDSLELWAKGLSPGMAGLPTDPELN